MAHIASALGNLLLDFFAFGEGRGLGGEGGDGGEAVGEMVVFAGCAYSWISSSSGTWDTSMSGLTSDWISGLILPRRAASCSGIGEDLCSPSTDHRSEVSTLISIECQQGNHAPLQISCHLTEDSHGATGLLGIGL